MLRFNQSAPTVRSRSPVLRRHDLVQERQLKTRPLHRFLSSPAANRSFSGKHTANLVGLGLYTLDCERLFTSTTIARVQVVEAILLWMLYAAILQGRHLSDGLTPKRSRTLR